MSFKVQRKAAARSSSATQREALATTSGSALDVRRQKITTWPEWNDADINIEKWETTKKEDKKNVKSPTQQAYHYFDDPEGKIELPPSLKVDCWKRPGEVIRDKIPVVLDTENGVSEFDLITSNEHLHESEFMRHCISQIIALREMSTVSVSSENAADAILLYVDPAHSWSPWEHIYSLCKAGKGPHLPLFNVYGKYVVRLYWMGCWRKITIDDTIPFDSQGRMLLPSTTLQHELWPMLLIKALIKIASLDYAGGSPDQEFGDMNVIQCLTGWIPEAIPLQQGHMNAVWELFKVSLPEWKLPLQEWESSPENADNNKNDTSAKNANLKEEKPDKETSQKDGKEKGKEKKDSKEKDKGGKDKDDKKDKKEKGSKGKDKDKSQEEKPSNEDNILPEKPEVVMFAAYNSTSKHPTKVSVLGEMADASEKLRQNGLSHMYSHVVYIPETRSCPLEPPPPPLVVPSWKLIRPRKKNVPPHDEPVLLPEEPKQIQCLRISSPFINYKVSQLPILTDTHRPKSALERGGTRSRADDNIIEEGEEDVSPQPSEPKIVVPVTWKDTPKEEESLKEKSVIGPKGKSLKKTLSKELKLVSAAKSKPVTKLIDSTVDKTGDSKPRELVFGLPVSGESGGLAVPPIVFKENNGLEDQSSIVDSLQTNTSPKNKSVWMDFDIFMKCFRTLYVYHKSNTYPCNQRLPEPKNVSNSAAGFAGKSDKKLQQATTMPTDGSSPFYLFVDNLAPTEIVVSFSVLPRWFDLPSSPLDERDRKSSVHLRLSKEKDLDKESTSLTQVDDKLLQSGSDRKSPPSVTPGSLIAEPYSWKSLVTGQPILRLRTTGTKAAVLSLPPGRHVLRFLVTSPLGHHVHMCSTVNFLLGDEETIMPHLTNESLRFRDNAQQLMTNLGRCILGFSNSEQFKMAWMDLVNSHCPYLNNKQMSKTHHFEIFNDALYQMLRKSIKDIITPEVAFSWRAFTFDVTSPNILTAPFASRPDSQDQIRFSSRMQFPDQVMSRYDVAPNATASHRSSGRPSFKKQSVADPGEADKQEFAWTNRQPSVIELVAAVEIQKAWRGYYVRKVKAARTPGTEENVKVAELLKKCWALLEANLEENGLFLLREMFRKEPDIIPYYPFYKDEWSKISYIDYKGMFPDQPSMSWFLIFRDIFYVKEEMLAVPYPSVPINTFILHVIDNDTGQEIPRVFQKVAPYVYKKNKKGFSFVAEAKTLEQPLPSGIWRLRLIGSQSALPAPQSGEVCCNFVTKEIRDYYLPNSRNIIFRQTVKVREDHFASIQMNTSRRGVYIKLAILDNEEEAVSVVGKGHVVIPAFTFLKNFTQEDFEKRAGSRASLGTLSEISENGKDENANKQSPPAAPAKGDKPKTRRSESTVSNELQQASRHSMRSEAELAERLEDTRVHKYIIQATVLQNSWPLSENSWRFVQALKEIEKNEQKLGIREHVPSVVKAEKVSLSGSKAKLQGGRPKGTKDKYQDSRGSQPSSQQFDFTKPHWTLRVVSDAVTSDEIDVKKDLERAEEIRAMKKAWEDAEPGRAAKALQSRLKYLNSHTIKQSVSDISAEPIAVESLPSISAAGTEAEPSTESLPKTSLVPGVFFNESETSLTLDPPPDLQRKEILEHMDITPFIRKTLPEPLYVDEEVLQSLMEKQQKEIAEFKDFRERVEKWREADKQNRNLAKMRQLEQYQALQAAVDEARDRINFLREGIRQRFLEAERLRLEKLANQEAAMKGESEGKSLKGNKKSAAVKKKK